MNRARPERVQALKGIGVDQMGDIGDSSTEAQSESLLRLENLDVNIPPHPVAVEVTSKSIVDDDDNSYLPFVGQLHLRNVAAQHVSLMTGGAVQYNGEKNCVISAGGLSGILNVLLATVEHGGGVLMTDPTYVGLINRVKLVGGVPKLVPLDFNPGGEWKLNREKLRKAVENSESKITTMLLMSPSLPSGAYFDQDDWQTIADLCIERDILVILDAAFERLLFDGRKVIHPASFHGMADRVITVGSASKELRMIGWRVGWIVGPEHFIADIATVGMANVVVPVGIAQRAAAAALEQSNEDLPGHVSEIQARRNIIVEDLPGFVSRISARRDMIVKDLAGFVSELQARRDIIVKELQGLPVGVPAGGWSLVIRVDKFGLTGKAASKAMLAQGICATAMDGWGEEHGSQYVRFVFSNEPQERLVGLGGKVRRALNILHS